MHENRRNRGIYNQVTLAGQERKTYLDILRILASIAVVTIHTIGKWFGGYFSMHLMWTTIYDGLARWAVPMFVMISGALLLRNGEIKLDEVKRRVFRIANLFIIWSVILVFFEVFFLKSFDSKTAIAARICNGGHLYYLYIAAGLYMVLPFLNTIYQNENNLKYFLILWLIFTFIIPRSQYYISWYLNVSGYESIASAMEFVGEISSIHFPIGYSGYFLMGGYLDRRDVSLKKGVILFLAGAMGTIGGTLLYTIISQNPVSQRLFEYFAVNCLLMCMGLFIMGKHIGNSVISTNIKDMFASLSANTMGIYFIHPMIIQATGFPDEVVYFFPLLTIPIAVLINWGISLIIVGILKKIPVVQKAL